MKHLIIFDMRCQSNAQQHVLGKLNLWKQSNLEVLSHLKIFAIQTDVFGSPPTFDSYSRMKKKQNFSEVTPILMNSLAPRQIWNNRTNVTYISNLFRRLEVRKIFWLFRIKSFLEILIMLCFLCSVLLIPQNLLLVILIVIVIFVQFTSHCTSWHGQIKWGLFQNICWGEYK